jgi:hypothetical protein
MIGAFLTLGYQNKLRHNWYHITGYIIEENINKSREFFNQHVENKLEDNTTVYLTPLSNFPSYKLKNYIEENKLNIKTSRKLNTLDALIINYDFLYSSYINRDIEEYYIIPSEALLQNPLLQQYISTENYYRIDQSNGENITHYFVSPEECKKLTTLDGNFYFIQDYYPLIKCVPISKSWGGKKISDNVGFFLNLQENIEKYNLKIIYDHHINKVTNEGLSIDEDIFENILNMISSQDESNMELAKEIMANLEFESSKPYFIYLFNYFYGLKTNRTNNKNYNYLIKQLKNNIHIKSTLTYPATIDNLLPMLITKYPEYSQTFMNCFRIHMNAMIKKNIIKEITVC